MQKRIALFPGSFDPITKGHEDIVLRYMNMFDEIVVAVGTNTTKNYMFDLPTRLVFIKNTFDKYPNVRVETYEGLTVNFAKKINASYMLRGLRNTTDFDYEKSIAQMNKELTAGIDTVFLITNPDLAAISSTILRELIKGKADVSAFVPKGVVIK